jgi:hypothetical protein
MDAKEPQVKREFLLALPQVEGQYGFEGRRVVNCGWTFDKKGGMNGVAFNAWYNDWLKSLYPNAKDVPGKRILDKSDSGPGHFGEAFNSRARLDGFYHFPSTPNATEVCQEMDQLFSYFKSLVYKNINTVLSKKRAFGSSAELRYEEGICCTLGLTVRLITTSGDIMEIELIPAYDKAFSPEKIQHAIDKCGYAPATRNSLNSERIRHEAVLDENGNADDVADPLGTMLGMLQQNNVAAVKFLEEKGYLKASLLKRSVITVMANQVASREGAWAVHHSREHQDNLMNALTAGDHFRATNGGEPTNSTDALLAMERKRMLKKASKLEKLKEKYAMLEESKQRARATEQRPYSPWKKDDFIHVIRWKQGLTAPGTSWKQTLYSMCHTNLSFTFHCSG